MCKTQVGMLLTSLTDLLLQFRNVTQGKRNKHLTLQRPPDVQKDGQVCERYGHFTR